MSRGERGPLPPVEEARGVNSTARRSGIRGQEKLHWIFMQNTRRGARGSSRSSLHVHECPVELPTSNSLKGLEVRPHGGSRRGRDRTGREFGQPSG